MDKGKNGKRNAVYLLLSILVACGIWLFADMTGGPNGGARIVSQEITDIPVEYTGEATLTDRGLMLVNDGTDLTVDLKVLGTRWLVDVLNAGTQSVNYRISFTERRFTDGITTDEVSIGGSATVNISELYRRNIEVKCDLVGSVAEGCTAGQVQLSNSEIEVRGLQEDIDPISYAKVTLDIGTGAAESVSQELEIQFYDAQGNLMENENIHPTVETIQATLPVTVTKEVRLEVKFEDAPGARISSADYYIEPATITVSGDATLLKDLDTLVLDTYKLAELGTTATQNYTTTNYPIILPQGCQNLSGVTRAALRIRFTDMTSATVHTDHVVWENLPEDKRAELAVPEIPVRIYGTNRDVSAVTGDKITITVDLGDYASASGAYTVPAKVSVASGDIGVQGEYNVQVTIRDGAEEPEEPPGEEPGAEPGE